MRPSRLIPFLLLLAATVNAQFPEPPNVILILADDMGYGDLAALNEGLNRTPHLDRLLQESVSYPRAYSGSPVCTPSRATLLTGRYPHRTGAVTLNMERFPQLSRLRQDELTLADLFRRGGYRTGLVGKWHLGDGAAYHPLRRGFDEFEGFKGFDIGDDYYNYRLDINGQYESFTGQYLTDNLTDRAIEFVTRHQDRPFFLHLAHYAPHRPLSAPQALVAAYRSRGYDEHTATVYAMIEVMDAGIGRLLHALDRLEIRERTLVIFASDNGPDPVVGERFNVDQRGAKYTVYEGGIHVPFLLNWPGTLPPRSDTSLVHFTDVLPTLAALCALPVPDTAAFDGRSFAGALLGGRPAVDPLPRFWQWNRGVPQYSHNAAVRDGRWKLVRPPVSRNLVFGASEARPLLFDVVADPGETTDLSATEPERYGILRVLLEQWSREVEHSRLREMGDGKPD